MARLLLLRHAKAEPASPRGDHERALSDRGVRDAASTGKAVAEWFAAGAVLCSTSTRTRQTWDEVSKELTDAPDPIFLREIYEPGGDYLDIVRRHGGSAETVLLIGHNPTIHATALALSGSLQGPSASSLARKFPTAALAVFDVDGDWATLQPGGARLREFIVPPGSPAD